MYKSQQSETLSQVYNAIMTAVAAEEIFGGDDTANETEQLRQVKKCYQKLRELLDPKNFNDSSDAEMAADASGRMEIFYEKAIVRINLGSYGLNQQPTIIGRQELPVIETAKRKYYFGEIIAEGDIATIYRGDCQIGDEFAGQVAIKVINDPTDNDLMANEIRILEKLHSQDAPQRKHLPTLLDRFRTDQGQSGIILRYLADCYDLVDVRDRYPQGIDRKHMVWMLNRLLSAIGYLHSQGITHNNIEPTHLMIRPRDHNLFLIDYSYATLIPQLETGEGFKVVNDDFSPPEVSLKEAFPTPATDIYCAGLCMIYALGGDIKERTVPIGIEEELVRFLETMTMSSQWQREQDAWQLHHQLNGLVVKLWGPKKFLRFEM